MIDAVDDFWIPNIGKYKDQRIQINILKEKLICLNLIKEKTKENKNKTIRF